MKTKEDVLLQALREIRDVMVLPVLLTPRRAAYELGICPNTLKEMIRRGEIGARKINGGGHWRVPAAEIYRLAQQLEVPKKASGGRKKASTYSPGSEAAALRKMRKPGT